MNRRSVLGSVATAGVIAVAGCSGNDPEFEASSGRENGDDTEEDIRILEHELVREGEGTDFETVSVDGRAENRSDTNYGYAEMRARFFNNDGDLVASGIDNINDFGAGQTWSFSVSLIGLGDDAAAVADYEIAVGTSF